MTKIINVASSRKNPRGSLFLKRDFIAIFFALNLLGSIITIGLLAVSYSGAYLWIASPSIIIALLSILIFRRICLNSKESMDQLYEVHGLDSEKNEIIWEDDENLYFEIDSYAKYCIPRQAVSIVAKTSKYIVLRFLGADFVINRAVLSACEEENLIKQLSQGNS